MLRMIYSKCCRKQDFNQLIDDFELHAIDWLRKESDNNVEDKGE